MTDIASALLELDDRDEERLAHAAPKLSLTPDACERIARVAYRISQVEAERARKVLPPGTILKPWRGFSARERAEAAATVLRIVQSLVLLGEAEAPADDTRPTH